MGWRQPGLNGSSDIAYEIGEGEFWVAERAGNNAQRTSTHGKAPHQRLITISARPEDMTIQPHVPELYLWRDETKTGFLWRKRSDHCTKKLTNIPSGTPLRKNQTNRKNELKGRRNNESTGLEFRQRLTTKDRGYRETDCAH